MREKGQAVFVSEWGHGARPAEVVMAYENGAESRVVVAFTDRRDDCHRDCFASSVFDTREEANRDAGVI